MLYGAKILIFLSQVFGAFLSTDVTERRKHDSDELAYFGTGECFVFTVRPFPAFFCKYSTPSRIKSVIK